MTRDEWKINIMRSVSAADCGDYELLSEVLDTIIKMQDVCITDALRQSQQQEVDNVIYRFSNR